MKLLIISLLVCVQVGAWAQPTPKNLIIGKVTATGLPVVKNPGNWTFEANYRTEWTRLGINTKHTVFDSTGFVIHCDTSRRIIYFIQDDGDTTDIPYGILETYEDDPYIYKKGVFYYKTAGFGDVEYRPGEMVRRVWPGEMDIVYSQQLKRRK